MIEKWVDSNNPLSWKVRNFRGEVMEQQQSTFQEIKITLFFTTFVCDKNWNSIM